MRRSSLFWMLVASARLYCRSNVCSGASDKIGRPHITPMPMRTIMACRARSFTPSSHRNRTGILLRSPEKDAEGLMQLMPATAEMYGVGNRYAVIGKSQRRRFGISSELLSEFHGDMRLAVAAYYCGPRHILQRGLSYSNPDVVAYVESVRNRYRRELLDRTSREGFCAGRRTLT